MCRGVIFLLFGIYFTSQCAWAIDEKTYGCFQYDESLLFTLKPNCLASGIEDSQILSKTNSLGLRGNELQAKAKNSIRILFIGASDIYGNSNDSNPAAYLERSLNELDPGHKYEVVNAGVPGYSAVQNLIELQKLIPLVHPDLVFQEVNLSAQLVSSFVHDKFVKKNGEGIAVGFDPAFLFWPLPSSWTNWLRNAKDNVRIIYWCRLLQTLTVVLPEFFASSWQVKFLENHLQYLTLSKRVATDSGAKYYPVTVEPVDRFMKIKEITFWEKPEWAALKFFPSLPATKTGLMEYRETLKQKFALVNAAPAFETMAQGNFIYAKNHYNEVGMKLHGLSMAKAFLALPR